MTHAPTPQTLDLAETISSTLMAFKVKGTVLKVSSGPRIDRYDVTLMSGAHLARLQKVAPDLALAFRVPSVRVVPDPSNGVVGLEVPRLDPQSLALQDVLGSTAFQETPAILPLAIGVTSDGQTALVGDLTTLPHLLVAGTTGSGKSTVLHAILTGLLLRVSPDDLKLVLMDPKKVEFGMYASAPHLSGPIITDAPRAALTLQALQREMDRRYTLLEAAGVKDIAGLRAAGQALPYMVVVIDELADLILSQPWGKDIELALISLAQKSRAAGIHLIAATQRPDARVLTGLIKANFPARIACRVVSGVNSRVILDQRGAEDLLGQGDMLVQIAGLPGVPQGLVRGQGASVDPSFTQAVLDRAIARWPLPPAPVSPSTFSKLFAFLR